MPKYDNNLIVIGAGSAGLVSALIATTVKAKVTLIEKHQMGGDCLNTGCVPSKALIRTAKLIKNIQQADKYGLTQANYAVDFTKVMARVHEVIAKIAPNDSAQRYESLGVNVIKGKAKIVSPHAVMVNGKTLSTKNIIIASGAEPSVPPVPGLADVDYLTSDNLWQLAELPRKLVILGGGPIGCEMAQAFARLGSEVYQFEMAERIMAREDVEVSELINEQFKAEGINLLLRTKTRQIGIADGRKYIEYEQEDKVKRLEFDTILVAVGRKAKVTGFGLEDIGVNLRANQTIEVDDFLRTNIPNIFIAGDAAGPLQFTHTASHQAWFATVNALFGGFKKFKIDYRVIPKVTFTDPEVASVGINELEAKDKNIPYETSIFNMDELDRAITDSSAQGWVKVLTVPGKDKILGVTIVAEHAGEILPEFVLAMKHGLGLNKILATVHAYPTLSEANKYVAGVWKKQHAPQKVLQFLEKFHQWMR